MNGAASEPTPEERSRSDIAAVIGVVRTPMLVLDASFCIVDANGAFADAVGIKPSDIAGQSIFRLAGGAWDTPELNRLLKQDLRQQRDVHGRDISPVQDKAGQTVRVNASLLEHSGLIVLAFELVRHSADDARIREANLITAIDSLPVGLGFSDLNGRFVLANPAMRRFAPKVIPSVDEPRVDRWRGYHPDGRRIERADYPGARALRGESVQPGIEFSYRDDDGSEVWTRIAAVPLRDRTGQVTGAAVVISDITASKRVEETLRASESRARRALDELEATYKTAPIGLCVLDTQLRFVRINDRLAEMNGASVADHIGRTPRELIPAVADQAEAALRRVLETGEPLLNVEITGEAPANPGVQGIWNESWFPLRDDAGQIIGINVVAEEITERRLNEERLKLLAQEVDHRSKNVLTLVATLVRLTRADSIETYRANLLGRLNALARSHQLLAASRWHGADLRDMISQELAAYRSEDATRVSLEGAAIEVQPAAAQALSMAIHELATNAAKYGALSVGSGRVAVSWQVSGGALRLTWIETGGPGVAPPQRMGLGTDIILRSVEDQLGGEIRKDWQGSGLVCVLTIPAASIVHA
jgi:PAS domain S-box-containing protein